MSFSKRCTHLLFGNAWGRLAIVLISVHVSGLAAFVRVALIVSAKDSYVIIDEDLRGVFQYGLLHFGQTRGSVSLSLGIHS